MNQKPIETAATWEQYGRLKDMNDDKKGMTQCLLKACRALRETQWTSDEDSFIQYGKFLCRLARSIVSSQSLETPEARGIKMEIKSALKQVSQTVYSFCMGSQIGRTVEQVHLFFFLRGGRARKDSRSTRFTSPYKSSYRTSGREESI